MSRRAQIRMSDVEVRSFLSDERTVICATNGKGGFPHLMPLWFVTRDSGASGGLELWAWTYGASQKVRNLERDPRTTLQVEAGEEYHLLRGVMLECDTVVHRDIEAVKPLGLEIMSRYAGGAEGPEVEAMVAQQAAKRVGLQFVERSRVTWDHRKLGGTY